MEERPIRGLVIAGWVTFLVPYGLSNFAALGANFQNETQWLVVPFAGPWITMGRRHYSWCNNPGEGAVGNELGCTTDLLLVMTLIADGLLQTVGGTLLLVGYMSQRPELVLNESAVRIRPLRMGSGYGLGLSLDL